MSQANSVFRIVLTYLTLLFVGCYNSADKVVVSGDELPQRTATIEQLRALVGNKEYYPIEESVVVIGRVTSSDSDDNFYGSIVVEDESSAIEVMVGLNTLSATYPEGLLVALRLNGCMAGLRRGVLQVGANDDTGTAGDILALGSREATERVIVRSTDIEPITAETTTIAELRREMCGRLLRIEHLTLHSSTSIDTLAGEDITDAEWRGYSYFFDNNGDSIAVYTSSYARYADKRIPTLPQTITGILQYGKYNGGKECYQLKMRYGTDATTYDTTRTTLGGRM